VQGEQEFPVPPLEIPRGAGTEAVAGSAAVRLFAQQAAMVRPARPAPPKPSGASWTCG